MKEVEIKFRISALPPLLRKLRSAGFRLVTRRTLEFNTLYDLPGEPLRQRGELLRVRRYGRLWTITFKGRATSGRHKVRTEIETHFDDGRAFTRILEMAGFQPGFRYEKYRSEWSDGRGHVVLDETPIGDFGEIEGPPRWIDTVARQLGLTPADYITDSYAQLFFGWKRTNGSSAEEMTFAAIQKPRRLKK